MGRHELGQGRGQVVKAWCVPHGGGGQRACELGERRFIEWQLWELSPELTAEIQDSGKSV